MPTSRFAHLRRALVLGTALTLSPLAIAPAGAAPGAVAQETTPTTAIQVQPEAQNSIIPIPQAEGTYEVQPGEPGSSEQYLVFVLIIGGLAAITIMVSRESKKKRAALGLSKPDPTTLYEEDVTK